MACCGTWQPGESPLIERREWHPFLLLQPFPFPNASQRGFRIHRRAIELSELPDFEEAFLCGTAAEIGPIASISEVKFKITDAARQLMEDFTAVTQAASE